MKINTVNWLNTYKIGNSINDHWQSENNDEKNNGSGGIRTHASEETGALNQRLRPLGHAT